MADRIIRVVEGRTIAVDGAGIVRGIVADAESIREAAEAALAAVPGAVTTTLTPIKTAAEAARDKAREWAESGSEPGPTGSKSAKTWAGLASAQPPLAAIQATAATTARNTADQRATDADTAATTAEAARDATLNALDGQTITGPVRIPAVSRTALAAVSTAGLVAGDTSDLSEAGYEGPFVWRPGDQSALVGNTRDVVPPASDLTGVSGVWQRISDAVLQPMLNTRSRSVARILSDHVSLADFLTDAALSDARTGLGSPSSAFKDAITAANYAFTGAFADQSRSGPRIMVPEGKFRHDGTIINLVNALHLIFPNATDSASLNPSTNRARSIIEIPQNGHGFHLNRSNTYNGTKVTSQLYGYGADGAVIENIALVGQDPQTATDRTVAGIWLRCRAKLIRPFMLNLPGDGIRILATAGSSDPTREGNANYWEVVRGRILACYRNVLIDGADANGGVGSFQVESALTWGIQSASTYGNEIIATADGNGLWSFVIHNGSTWYVIDPALAPTTEPGTNPAVWGLKSNVESSGFPAWTNGGSGKGYQRGGAFYGPGGGNNRTHWAIVYTEGNQPPSLINVPNRVDLIGHDDAGILGTARVTQPEREIVPPSGITFSRPGVAETVIMIPQVDTPFTVAGWSAYLTGTDFMRWTYDRTGAQDSFQLVRPGSTTVTFGRSAAPRAGAVNFHRGFYLGNTGSANNSRRLAYAATIPAGDGGRGDITFSYGTGREIGWQATAAGTGGGAANGGTDAPQIPIYGAAYEATATYDPPSLAPGVMDAVQTATVTGAALGDIAAASFSRDLQGVRLEAWVSAADTVSYRFSNPAGASGTINLASGTVRLRAYK